MPRLFNRVLTFHVEGEIYDHETKPEDIIKNYNWSFKDNSDDNHFFISAQHKDNRGRITKMTKLPKIHRWKKPDTEFFLNM
jgi:hypothetical protein